MSCWTSTAPRWILPAGLILTWIGYFGSWVAHPAAGLVILGLDLAEYVKFLAEVRAGQIPMWREWFLLPAAAASLGLTLTASSRELRLHLGIKIPLVAASLLAALAMLPPAWSPAVLLSPEFRMQTALTVLCLAALPLWRLHSRVPGYILSPALGVACLAIAAGALRQFLLIKPAIDRVYEQPPAVGWGLYVYLAGALILFSLGVLITCFHYQGGPSTTGARDPLAARERNGGHQSS